MFGAYDVDAGDEYNAAVFLEPPANGRLEFETYRKAWLFPLTERVPGSSTASACAGGSRGSGPGSRERARR